MGSVESLESFCSTVDFATVPDAAWKLRTSKHWTFTLYSIVPVRLFATTEVVHEEVVRHTQRLQ